jgi:restriction system protein
MPTKTQFTDFKIDPSQPATWRELQNHVARILREAGVITTVEKRIRTARGKVSIDVWAHDPTATPTQTYLIECKRWRKRVPQTVVHAFRTIVGDSGANWGAIISATGFQQGARIASKYTNVRLLSWAEFEALFVERWMSNHFTREIAQKTDPLLEYTEPINSRIFRKADALSANNREKFKRLRALHSPLASVCMVNRVKAIGLNHVLPGADTTTPMPSLPLRKTMGAFLQAENLSIGDDILDAGSFRSLLESILSQAKRAIAQFDEVFGERA